MDVGLKVLLATAAGQLVANPRHYRKAEKHLKQAQQRGARRTRGSMRRTRGSTPRKKAVHVLAKRQQQVRRHRRDFHHQPPPDGARAAARVRRDARDERQVRTLSRRPQPQPDGNGS
jgi:putative transposase